MATLSFLSLPPLLLHVILVSFPLRFKLNLCRLFLWLLLHGPLLAVGVFLFALILDTLPGVHTLSLVHVPTLTARSLQLFFQAFVLLCV